MSSANNVISLADYRKPGMQEIIDDISARAFLYLRDSAEAEDAPMYAVIAEHILGMALVVQAVEGSSAAKDLLSAIAAKLD
ncbi:MAG TPA: hypothetical protein VLC91_03590 [Spongiibacteraceae bacterium]|nr:hypothetical protein [Spongiibacteraceae bacterium]